MSRTKALWKLYRSYARMPLVPTECKLIIDNFLLYWKWKY